jgi:hypothetical protein
VLILKGKMRIEDSKGNDIASFDDWAKLYDSPRTSYQWKEHRSAYSAATFIMHRNGAEQLRTRVADALGEPVEFEKAIPEYEVRFDKFGRGRVHDVAIFGLTYSGKHLFVGVEAKVDEPFGAAVRDAYLIAKAKQIAGISTNAPERIENLLRMHFKKPDVSMFDIRYQLLYATAGTLAVGADFSVLYIAVFRTAQYNETTNAENYRDYTQFMCQVGAKPLDLSSKAVHGYKLSLKGKELICLHEHFNL